ncbi:MAG: multidrug ABC transporter ATP-binding protein, partial [Planctomycetes bacterium]|nr:multidrug ABC transporter ATP-binding protein [Planctomycetota bacterium]
DPRARVEMRELLRELQRLGKTIVISSHLLHELSQLCSHLCILERGKSVANGTMEELCTGIGLGRSVHIKLARSDEALLAAIAAIPGVEHLEAQHDRLILRYTPSDGDVDKLHDALMAAGAKLRMFEPDPVDVEALYLGLTRKHSG